MSKYELVAPQSNLLLCSLISILTCYIGNGPANGTIYLNADTLDATAITNFIGFPGGSASFPLTTTGQGVISSSEAADTKALYIRATGANSGVWIDTTGTAGRFTVDSAGNIILKSTGSYFSLTAQGTGVNGKSVVSSDADTGTDDLLIKAQSGTGQLHLTSVGNSSVGAIKIDASAGGLTIDAQGAASQLVLQQSGGGAGLVQINSLGTGFNAIQLNANNAAGGIDMNAGTTGIDLASTAGPVNITAQAPSKFEVSNSSLFKVGTTADSALALYSNATPLDGGADSISVNTGSLVVKVNGSLGTAGQVLTSNGSTASWGAAGGFDQALNTTNDVTFNSVSTSTIQVSGASDSGIYADTGHVRLGTNNTGSITLYTGGGAAPDGGSNDIVLNAPSGGKLTANFDGNAHITCAGSSTALLQSYNGDSSVYASGAGNAYTVSNTGFAALASVAGECIVQCNGAGPVTNGAGAITFTPGTNIYVGNTAAFSGTGAYTTFTFTNGICTSAT